MTTTGDRDQRPDLHAIGGTGVFVKEVQQAVLDGRADLAVHSAKDLPSETPEGLVLAAIPERGDPRDALVGAAARRDPDRRPHRHRIGAPARAARPRCGPTSCSHRCAAASRPGCASRPTKVTTRSWSRLPRSTVSASASGRARCSSPTVLLPQAAQGALAVECRADDERARARAVRDRRPHRPHGGPGRARVPRGARRRLHAAVRRARGASIRRRVRSCSTRCSPRPTVTSCCARGSRDRIRSRWARPRRATSSTARAAARCSTSRCRRERRRVSDRVSRRRRPR